MAAGSKQIDADLVSAGTLDGDEELHVVDDPSGTPESKKTTAAALSTFLEGDFLLLDATNDPVTGQLTISAPVVQPLVVDNSNAGGQTAVEIGSQGSGDRVSQLDLTGDDTYTAYGLRIQRSAGANGTSRLRHRGTGALRLEADDAGTVVVRINGATVMTLASGSIELAQPLVLSSSGPEIHTGSGSPESAVSAPVGSMYLRDDGGASTTLYIKESGAGNTGWVAK